MLKSSETQSLMAVIDRLAVHFPDEPRSVIEDVVALEHRRFDDGRIRDYIPILVERAAKQRLGRR